MVNDGVNKKNETLIRLDFGLIIVIGICRELFGFLRSPIPLIIASKI